MRALVILAVLITSATAHTANATPVDDVTAATQGWVDAFNTRNPDRVLALYETDAVLWGTTSVTLRNTPATRHEYFGNMPQRPNVRVVLGEQHVRVYGDIAINTGTYTFSNNQDGKATSTPARFSFTFHRQNGRWMIVDHHSSAVPAPPK